MVIEMTSEKIRTAVKDCLTRCYQGTPLGVIAEFSGELRDAGWDESDIRQVETAVRRVLAGMMGIDEALDLEPQ